MANYLSAAHLEFSDTQGTWIVVANREEATFYKKGSKGKLEVVERLINPEGCLKDHELTTDRSGRGFSSSGAGSIRHALNRRSNRFDQVAKVFAQKIGKALELARKQGRFSEIEIVADPKFLGLIRKAVPVKMKTGRLS